MSRQAARRRVASSEAEGYAAVARQFQQAAGLAQEFEYWNAAGLLFVHAAIAWADAACFHLKSVKSISENHKDAVGLLADVSAGLRSRDEAIRHLDRLIDEKNRVAYTGTAFRREAIQAMAQHAARFMAFAEAVLRS